MQILMNNKYGQIRNLGCQLIFFAVISLNLDIVLVMLPSNVKKTLMMKLPKIIGENELISRFFWSKVVS